MQQEMSGGERPPDVPATEIVVLHDPGLEKAVVILFFDSEADYAQGDAALNAMPAADTPGTRTGVQAQRGRPHDGVTGRVTQPGCVAADNLSEVRSMGIAVPGFTLGFVPEDEPEPSGFGRRALAWAVDVTLMWVLVVFTCLVAVMLPEAPGALVGLYAVIGVVPTDLDLLPREPERADAGQAPARHRRSRRGRRPARLQSGAQTGRGAGRRAADPGAQHSGRHPGLRGTRGTRPTTTTWQAPWSYGSRSTSSIRRQPTACGVTVLGAGDQRPRQGPARLDPALQGALLRAQTEALLDGILFVSGEGRILLAGIRRFAEIWGVPDEQYAATK